MNLNNYIAYRPLRLGPLHQLHPGRSRSLVSHHNRLHPAPPFMSAIWNIVVRVARCFPLSCRKTLIRDVCRYGNPGALAARPVIGVTAPAMLAVGGAVVKARMDDRKITEQADSHVLGPKPA